VVFKIEIIMKKILVPVDFSLPSSWGFYYAYDLAKATDAELIVLHLFLPKSDPTFLSEELSVDKQKKKAELLHHLKAATQKPMDSNSDFVKVSYEIDYGHHNQITLHAEHHKVDLIVMGTHGAGKAMNKVMGSNTSKVIKESPCPVLAIPEGALYSNKQNIAYATNFNSKDIESITHLAKIAAATNSNLCCIHVNLFSSSVDEKQEKEFEEEMKDKFKGLPISFFNWSATSVEEGLEIFCRINDIKILAVLTENKTMWKKMFGEKSLTKTLALNNNIPLLAFHE
jgi:nucleotide-binding universal stress UspA family protein